MNPWRKWLMTALGGIALAAALTLVAPGDLMGWEGSTLARSTIYVDVDATGANDGSSWEDAYTTLQAALDESNANGAALYEIWVAEGVYYPDEGGSHVNNDRTESFRLSYDNVQLYGGFAGGETAREERDWQVHTIILSGDIDQDSTLTNNAYHVLWLDGQTNQSISGATVLDGFTITAGNADGSYPDFFGGGLYCAGRGSGHACSPALTNVTFSGNTAKYGGGMYNDGSYGTSSPTLTNVTFSANTGTYYGGGMLNSGGYGTSSPALTNVTFSANTAYEGGGMYNDATSGTSSPVLTNVTFSSNTATWSGGGMYNYALSGTSNPTVVNSILWGDTGGEIRGYNTNPTVTYSIVQGGHVGEGNLAADPRLGPLGDYGGGMATLPLLPGSPAIDAADLDSCPDTDQRGVDRRQGARCDMGAYESRGFALYKSGGDNQVTPIDTAFATPLSVTLSEIGGTVLPGATITFTAPASGASIAPPTTVTATTDVSGVASISVMANGTPGTYHVTASAADVAGVDFALANVADLLSIAKAVIPSSAAPGQAVTYILSFANHGDIPATGVVITDLLPAAIEVTGVISSGVAVTDSHHVPPYVWQVADLPPGDSGTIIIDGLVSPGLRGGTVIPNQAEISSDVPEAATANNVGQADVTVLNVAPVLAAIPDQTVAQLTMLSIITVASDANGDALTFDLPAGPPGASITPAGVFGWTPAEEQGPGVYTATVRVTDDSLPPLDDSQTFTITVTVKSMHVYLPIVRR